jgi:ABC-type polysaccharide/polyol phosphate transport system, ATPase component
MSDIAIRIEGLSKSYQLGQAAAIGTLRDTLMDMARAPFRRVRSILNREAKSKAETIWALRDINCEIKHGEIVGVIGRNGAGKSTLLKILSRITDPTGGFAEVRGRVGSLLEVGTGFHAELTGRENIYLNGSILGMRKGEIERKFDEIVEFAGTGKFIDTQVKHYSSGMYLRLAFAVAAHLEPDVLLVDEVLSVGDLEFQRKCIGKMEDVASQGRTVLFVSHNLAAIKELCQTSIVLDAGSLLFRGTVVEGLARYSEIVLKRDESQGDLKSTGWRQLTVNGQHGASFPQIQAGEPFSVEGILDLKQPYLKSALIFIVEDAAGDTMVHRYIESNEIQPGDLPSGRYEIRVDLPPLWLAPGIYTAYFKFLGHRQALSQNWNTFSSTEDRPRSERIMLDVVGDARGISRASLAPNVRWGLTSVRIGERSSEERSVRA